MNALKRRVHESDFFVVRERWLRGYGGSRFGSGTLIVGGIVGGGLDGPSSLAEALIHSRLFFVGGDVAVQIN